MSNLLFAKDLFQEYRNRSNLLLKDYTTVKQKYPYNDFTALINAIRGASALAEVWGKVAVKVEQKPYWEEQ